LGPLRAISPLSVAFINHIEESMNKVIPSSDVFNWNSVLQTARAGNPTPPRRDERTEEAWRAELSAEAFHVMRQHGTERAHSSEMCRLFTPGRYACGCCKTLLFDAQTKFDSGTGWPSFTQAVAPNVVAYKEDRSYGMSRVEVLCNICDAHLGHVFPDGPPPTGLRYCINAVSLEKVSEDAP
jgi:peptide-methionine (R)-S-oxide reductase